MPEKPKDVIDFENQADYIINNISYLFPNYSYFYESFESENPDAEKETVFKRTVSFYNKNANEHMFTIYLVFIKKTLSFNLTIMDSKLNDVSVSLGNINWNMFQYQIYFYQAYLEQSVKYSPYWKKNKVYFNTFESIISDMKKGFGDIDLTDVTQYNDQELPSQFEFQLKSKDNLIGYFSIFSNVAEDEKYLQNLDLQKNYMINMNLSIAKDNKIEQLMTKMPVLTNSSNYLKNFIEKNLNEIDLNNQINDFDTLEKFLREYYKKRIPKMEWKTNENSENERIFYVSHEYSHKYIKISKTLNENGYLSYSVLFDDFDQFIKPSISFNFMRCSKKIFESKLDEFKADKMFKTIYDDVIAVSYTHLTLPTTPYV